MKSFFVKLRKRMILCLSFLCLLLPYPCFANITGITVPLPAGLNFEKSYWDLAGSNGEWLYVTSDIGGVAALWNTDTKEANTVALAWTPGYATDYLSLTNCPPTGQNCIAVATTIPGLYMAFSYALSFAPGWVPGVGTPGQVVAVNSIATSAEGAGATVYAKMSAPASGTSSTYGIQLSQAFVAFYQKGSNLQTGSETFVKDLNKGIGLYMPDIDPANPPGPHRETLTPTGTVTVKAATCGSVANNAEVGDGYQFSVNMDDIPWTKLFNVAGAYSDKSATTTIELECQTGITPKISFIAKNPDTDNGGAQTLIGVASGSAAKGVAIQLKSGSIGTNALNIDGTQYNFAGSTAGMTQGTRRAMDLDFYYYKKSGVTLEPGTFSAILTVNLIYN